MAYIAGFVIAVPAANKEAYRKHVADAAALFKEYGATRMVEAWGDDVPDGKVTDLRGAVQAKPGEVIVYAWQEYPDKAAAEAAKGKMLRDPRMRELGSRMPLDGSRMIIGGFSSIIDTRGSGATGYIDGSVLPAPIANKEAYCETAATLAAVIREYGAIRVLEAWGDDIPDGKVTDYRSAVKAQGDETVVFAFIEWPSKEVRDAGWQKIIADKRMHPDKIPYDPHRRIHGGFAPILDA